MGPNPCLGELFRSRRQELGWSLAGVVRRVRDLGASLSESQLQRIEQGQVPRADHLAALCRVYGLPDGNLLDVLLAEGEGRVRLPADRGRAMEELLAEGDDLLGAGRHERARARYVRAKLEALKGDDFLAVAWIDLRLAWLERRAGFFEAAFQRAVRLAEDESLPREIRYPALTVEFRSLVLRGWLELAGGLLPAIERVARDRGVAIVTRAAARAAAASWWRARGDVGRALEEQRAAVDLLGRAGAARERLRASLDLAGLLLEAGKRRAAIARLRAVERATRCREYRGLRPEVLRRLGVVLVDGGRLDEGVRVLEEADEFARDYGREKSLYVVRAWLLRALRGLGRNRDARSLEVWLTRNAARHADLPEARVFLRGGAERSGKREPAGSEATPNKRPGEATRKPGGEA